MLLLKRVVRWRENQSICTDTQVSSLLKQTVLTPSLISRHNPAANCLQGNASKPYHYTEQSNFIPSFLHRNENSPTMERVSPESTGSRHIQTNWRWIATQHSSDIAVDAHRPPIHRYFRCKRSEKCDTPR